MNSPLSGNVGHSRFTMNKWSFVRMKLDCRFVLHIPLSKWENGKIISLDVDGEIAELTDCLEADGFDSFYITRVESRYRSRKYDELLITIFACEDHNPCGIFRKWFCRYNHILGQEAFAIELNNRLIIEDL